MFVRAYPGPDGRTVVDVGGLARSDPAGGFGEEFSGLAGALETASAGPAGPATASPGPGTETPSLTTTTEGKSH